MPFALLSLIFEGACGLRLCRRDCFGGFLRIVEQVAAKKGRKDLCQDHSFRGDDCHDSSRDDCHDVCFYPYSPLVLNDPSPPDARDWMMDKVLSELQYRHHLPYRVRNEKELLVTAYDRHHILVLVVLLRRHSQDPYEIVKMMKPVLDHLLLFGKTRVSSQSTSFSGFVDYYSCFVSCHAAAAGVVVLVAKSPESQLVLSDRQGRILDRHKNRVDWWRHC